LIFLDHNAATPLRPEARAALAECLEVAGNPSSIHAAGRAARDRLDAARDGIARALKAHPREIVFTSGATEGAALAIRGILGANRGRRGLVITAVEHPCIRDLAAALAAAGTPVTTVPVDGSGLPDLEALRAAVGPDTALVCAMMANNETGVLLPIQEMAAICRNAGAPLLCDAAQGAGKLPIDVATWGPDLAILSGQKLGGPRGSGVLWARSGLPLAPLFGGHQERGRRAGTENLPAAAGLGAALAAAIAVAPEEQPRVTALRDRLERGLLGAVPDARVNGATAPRLAGTSSLTLPGCDGEALLMALDLAGICASAGSACTSGSTRPSHVLAAMGLSPEDARATLRLSLGWTTTDREIEAALDRIPPLVQQVRRALR
jgi:cysteine desulfurase